MKRIPAGLACPSCRGALQPRLLVCEACELKVEGHFHQNEFASLEPEDLHFLRIFILCEGRIRDMESALGVSYPTLKARMAEFKAKALGSWAPSSTQSASAEPSFGTPPEQKAEPQVGSAEDLPPPVSAELLEALEQGKVSFDEALASLKRRPKGERK